VLRAEAAGTIIPQIEPGGDLVGFIMHGPCRRARPCVVWQCAVRSDARRLRSATLVVSRLVCHAAAAGCSAVTLRCAADIEAVQFWKANGFEAETVETGVSGRSMIRFLKILQPTLLPGHVNFDFHRGSNARGQIQKARARVVTPRPVTPDTWLF
jgi:GNAT superfamily N-acetyltransferase